MSNLLELNEAYRVLEVKPGATLAEVERAYETLAKSWDPRRFGGDEARRRKADRKLRQLERAYQILRVELGAEKAPEEAEPAVTPEEEQPVASAPTEPQRHWTTRWRYIWLVALIASLAYLLMDSNVRLETIKRTTEISMVNFPLPEHDPNSPTGYPGNQHKLVLPALGTDGQHWTMQTERMLDGREGWRVRHVDYDGVTPTSQISGNTVNLNSSQAEKMGAAGTASLAQTSTSTPANPDEEVNGREVHWSGSLHWLSAGLAWVEHLITHEPITYTLENTVQWANTFALGLVMLFLPFAMVWRFGAIATAILSICFIAVYPYYEFSFVGYFDHHGLAATSDLLIVLFIAGAGAGWLRNEAVDPATLGPVEKALWQWLPDRRQAKRWMIASGIAVGAGVWVSTASIIPALIGVGFGALIGTGFFSRTAGRCSSPLLKVVSPWIIWIATALGTAFAMLFVGIVPGILGGIAGAIAATGMVSGTLLPSLASLGIALSAYFADAGGNFWPTGHWIGVWGGIFGAAIGGGFTFGLAQNPEEKTSLGRTDPTLWRVWGCAAGLASLFFYLLEYAPAHFSMRLEVNHPLYSLALVGAGDVMCRLCWFIGGREEAQTGFWRRQWPWVLADVLIFLGTGFGVLLFQQRLIALLPLLVLFIAWLAAVAALWAVRYFSVIAFDQPRDAEEAYWRKNWLRIMLSLAAIAILPTIISLFGEKVFVIRPGGFLMNLHQDYILEFRSFLRQMSTLSPVQIVGGISMIPLAALPLGLLFFAKELQRPWKAVLLAGTLPAFGMLAFAAMQIRWLGISCAMWCAGLAVAALVTTSPGSAFRWGAGFRKPLAALLLTVVLVPFTLTTTMGWFLNRDSIGELDLQQIVTRDLSQRLRLRLGNETGVVLSGPTTTTWMMYFGGFHGIGSLYWENVKGLETAGEIYSADHNSGPQTWDEAKALVDKYHITHIAVYSWDPFAMEYARLGAGMRLPKNPQEERDQFYTLRNAFMVKLWWEHMAPPVWLRYVPYQVPSTPLLKGNSVILLEVVPPQTPIDANLRIAQYYMGKNTPEDLKIAGQVLDYIFQLQPGYYPALITKAMYDQVRAEAAARAGNAQEANDAMAAYKAETQLVYDNLAKASEPTFAFEDRVNLCLLLFNNNHKQEAFVQVQKCFETATEKDLRHLPMDRLLALLQVQVFSPADIKSPPKTLDLALSLLPKPLQAQILAERAAQASQSNPAEAIALYHKSLALAPDLEPALTGLAKLLVLVADPKLHNGEEALKLATLAAKNSRTQSTENIQILACASAELGKFDDAVFYAKKALMLLEDVNGKQAASDWAEQVKRFENHQTFKAPDTK